MSKHQQKISQNVLSQIKNGDVKMRPRTYFTLLSSLIIIASIIAGIILSYLSSIIFFWIRITASDSAAYGARRNLSELVSSFPWWSILVIVGLIALITFLIRRYGNLYKHKTRDIVIVILLISVIFGAGLSALGFGDIRHPGQQFQQNGPWWNKKLK